MVLIINGNEDAVPVIHDFEGESNDTELENVNSPVKKKYKNRCNDHNYEDIAYDALKIYVDFNLNFNQRSLNYKSVLDLIASSNKMRTRNQLRS